MLTVISLEEHIFWSAVQDITVKVSLSIGNREAYSISTAAVEFCQGRTCLSPATAVVFGLMRYDIDAEKTKRQSKVVFVT